MTATLSEADWPDARRNVLWRYARLDGGGKPVMCRSHRNKIVFDSWRDAADAAAELERYGARSQEPYEHEDHYHLYTVPGAKQQLVVLDSEGPT